MKRAGAFLAGLTAISIVVAVIFSRPKNKESEEAAPVRKEPGSGTAVPMTSPKVATKTNQGSATPTVAGQGGGLLEGLSSDTVERKPQIDKLIETMSTAERVKALDELWSEDATGARHELTGELLRKWAQEMPQAAGEWLAKKPGGPMQREAARSVAMIWANQNVADAAAWVRNWPEQDKESGLLAVAYEAIRTAPMDALWLASELNPSSARDSLIAHAVREWAINEPEAPVAWAEKMDNSALRDQVYASTAISLSETDPVGAANLALQKLPTGEQQDDTVVSIVQRWAQTEPASAADWVVQFPQGKLRDAAVENLVRLWADNDTTQTVEWLEGLEGGPVRDVGLATYARKLAPSTPESALTWAEKITDPEIRAREMESLVSLWMQSDRQAAFTWIQTAALSDEAKTRLRTSGEAGQP